MPSPTPDTTRAVALATPGRVQVIATTPEGTSAALVEARNVARCHGIDCMTLLMPRTNLLAASMAEFVRARPDVDGGSPTASPVGVAISERLCFCEGHDDALQRLVAAGGVVVVGGRRRWWWPTPEQRLAANARRSGHHTIFADVTQTTARSQ